MLYKLFIRDNGESAEIIQMNNNFFVKFYNRLGFVKITKKASDLQEAFFIIKNLGFMDFLIP